MQRLVQSFVRYNFFVIATPTATTTFPKNLIAIVVTTFLKNIIATLLANFFNPFSRFKRKKTLWILLENPQKFPPIVIHWKEKNFKVVIIATMVATCNELLHHKANQVQIKYIKCTFSSNKIVQKISFSLCFGASDHLIDKSN